MGGLAPKLRSRAAHRLGSVPLLVSSPLSHSFAPDVRHDEIIGLLVAQGRSQDERVLH